MKEIKYIMTTMTENSLIIIDELCRSTSLEEGTALAIATVEKMAQSSAFIYITTHFTMLTKLYDMYLNVKLWQLETIPSGDDPKTFKLDFKYNLISGVTSVKRYGVYIVRNIWSDGILKYVDEMLDKITKKPTNPKFVPIDEKIRFKYNVESQFRKLKFQNKLTIAEVNRLLTQYRNDLQKLGYLINIVPLTSVDSFTENIDAHMPQIVHSVFDNSQNFPEYNQNCVEEDLESRGERMKHIFTPDVSISSHMSTDLEARKIEKRMDDLFTPELCQQPEISNNYPLHNTSFHNKQNDIDYRQQEDNCSDSSSYRDISKFIGENSVNIDKLIPEVNISYSDMSNYSQSSSYISQNALDLREPDTINQGANKINSFIVSQHICQPRVLSKQLNTHVNFERTSSIELSKDMNDFRFSIPLSNDFAKTSTPIQCRDHQLSKSSSPVVHIYSQNHNFSVPSSKYLGSNYSLQKDAKVEVEQLKTLDGIDLESLQDDLEVCSNIFGGFDDDFEETSLNTTYRSFSNGTNFCTEKHEIQDTKKMSHPNIMPTVTIIPGPNNTTVSIDENNLKEDSKNNSIAEIKEPKTKINIISDIAVTANGNIKTIQGHNLNNNSNSEKLNLNINFTKQNSPESVTSKSIKNDASFKQDLHTSINKQGFNIFQIVEQSDDNTKIFHRKTESTNSTESNEVEFENSSVLYDGQFTNYRDTNPNASNYSFASFKSLKSDNTLVIENVTSKNGKLMDNNTDYNENSNDSYKSIDEKRGEIAKSSCDWSNSKAVDESYKSLAKDGDNNLNNSDTNTRQNDNLNESTINKKPEISNCNSSGYKIALIRDYIKFGLSIDEATSNENCFQIGQEGKLANNISVEEKQKTEEKFNPFTNANRTDTTSISNASKLRNLDQVTSDSSPHEESTKKTTSINNDITSISNASKKRNLDDITTTFNPSEESNNKSICTTKVTDKSETTSSMKESDVSEPERKKIARKKFSIPRSSENRRDMEDSQTSAPSSKKSKIVKKSRANQGKFIPPRKLSAKEIREEFREQDRKILESSPNSSNFSKYLEQLIKRPSVKQIQNTTHLALIRKTHEGVEVIPAEPSRTKRKRSPIKKHFSNEKFSMSIFSDKNAIPFENYLNSNVKDYKTFNFNFGTNQENVAKEEFKFVPTTESFNEYTNKSVTKRFVRTASEIVKSKTIFSQENINAPLIRRNSETSQNTQLCFSGQSISQTLTPDGFYKQNKDDIKRILNKYLTGGDLSYQQEKTHTDKKRNIFENTDLSTSDLNI